MQAGRMSTERTAKRSVIGKVVAGRDAPRAEFMTSAARAEQFPEPSLPEFAFLGRSNVGKSSLLNRLAGRDGLAFTSARPGCTQLVNFFRVEDSLILVDLPGYGYAKVPKEITGSWQGLIEAYLLERKSLALCLLLLDARRGWMQKDLELKQWLEFHNRPYLVVATKIDKLKTQKEQHHGMAALRSQSTGSELIPFSAVTGRGAREIWQAIWKTKNQY